MYQTHNSAADEAIPKTPLRSLNLGQHRELQADVARLTKKLKNAELIIEVQKKWLRCAGMVNWA